MAVFSVWIPGYVASRGGNLRDDELRGGPAKPGNRNSSGPWRTEERRDEVDPRRRRDPGLRWTLDWFLRLAGLESVDELSAFWRERDRSTGLHPHGNPGHHDHACCFQHPRTTSNKN